MVSTQPYDTKFDLITLEERNKLVDFVNGLITEHKTWMDEQMNEEIKEQIIHKAIEEAKLKGVIK